MMSATDRMEYNRPMSQAQKPSVPSLPIPSALFRMAAVFAVLGWLGAAALVLFTLPFLLPRWLLFFSLFAAFTGTALPIVWYLNRRFSGERFPSNGVLMRETLELAALGVFLLWLQAGRMFTAFLGWIFFAVFLAVELLLRVYEHTRWLPSSQPPASSGPASPDNPASSL
jgi:hypothetical protein